MRNKQEIPFSFDKGVFTATPEISSTDLALSRLENFVPVFNRLKLLRSHIAYTTVPNDETVRAIATYLDLSTKVLEGYILTDDNAYKLSAINSGGVLTIDGEALTIDGQELVIEFSSAQFQGTFITNIKPLVVDGQALLVDGEPLVFGSETTSFDSSSTSIISWSSWDDTASIYFTRPGLFLSRIQDDLIEEVIPTFNDGTNLLRLSARYMLISGNRLFLANITTDQGDNFGRRLQWSDLYNPEDFQINRAKEGDFFELENNNLEITGLHEHRGYPVVFSRQSIWRAIYLGLPQKYRFEPVRNNIGNAYHYSSVSVREQIYFVSDDNFYVMDGFSVIPIGDAIWKTFIEQNETTIFEEMLAFHDPFLSEVAWKFTRKGDPSYMDYRQDSHPWLIVYNYKESRWSFRSADGMESYNVNRYPISTSVRFDDMTKSWDEAEETWDGSWQDVNIPSSILIGRQGDLALYQQGQFIDKDNAPLTAEAESHELFYDSIMDSKEVSEIKLSYSATGSPSIKVSLGYRNNQFQPFTWTREYEQQSITGENELRFLLDVAIRAKFYKMKLQVTNDASNFMEELNGGSILVTGMKTRGTEI